MKLSEIDFVYVDRANTIGGTDMSVLMGVNKWKTYDQLINEKLGKYKVEVNDAMYWGSMAEPMIAKHIQDNLEQDLTLFDPGATDRPQVLHPDLPIISGSIDRLVISTVDEEVIEGIEIKTGLEWTAKKWKEAVPDYYVMQVQTYMMCLGMEHWRVCALIGNRTYIEHIVEADYFLWDEMVEKAIAFDKDLRSRLDNNVTEALEKYEEVLNERASNEEAVCIPMGKS